MKITQVSDSEFQKAVRAEGLTFVDFTALWCPPCKVLLPILEELADDLGESVGIMKVDVDDAPLTAGQFGVMSMPTVILFKDGQPVERLVGLRPKEAYRRLAAKHMARFI